MAGMLIDRARLLMQQSRYEEAGRILKDLLHQEPNNVYVLALLCQVKLEQDDLKQAEQLINSAIGLSPDTSYLYYVKAIVARQCDQYDAAEKCLAEAINLNPEEAPYFALWASVKLLRKQPAAALELANNALERDPENILALNIRSTALLKLNRKEESFAAIEGALAHDPNNPVTHINYGWGLLEKGDHKKALVHFREALKNNPGLQEARSGMAEALKAKYGLYRLFLTYAFFMNNLTAKYQWGVIIGFYLAGRVLQGLASRYESLQPILLPVIILLALAAFSTWVIMPVSNLFLRFNPYGKYLLGKEEKLSADFVAVSVLQFAAGLVFYLLLQNSSWLVVALVGFAMMVPLSTLFTASGHKNKLVAYAAGMFVLGVLGIYQAFRSGEPFNTFTTIFLFSFIAYQWIANFLRIRQSNL